MERVATPFFQSATFNRQSWRGGAATAPANGKKTPRKKSKKSS
jgi:hypothetical protein